MVKDSFKIKHFYPPKGMSIYDKSENLYRLKAIRRLIYGLSGLFRQRISTLLSFSERCGQTEQ